MNPTLARRIGCVADTAWETGLAIAVAFIPVWLHHVAENIAARFGMPFLPGRFTQEVLMFSILNSPAGYVILHSKVRQFRRIGLVAAFQAPASIGVCGFLFVLSWLFYLDIAIAEGAFPTLTGLPGGSSPKA